MLTIALVGVFAVNNPAKAADKFTEDPTLLDDEIAVYIMDSIMTTFPNYYDNDVRRIQTGKALLECIHGMKLD